MQAARGFPNYHLNYSWPQIIYCVCQPNERTGGGKQGAKGKSGGPWPTQVPP